MKRRTFIKTIGIGITLPLIHPPKLRASEFTTSIGNCCRFAVGGDYHFGAPKRSIGHYSPPERLQTYADKVNEQNVDFSIHVGDLTMYAEFELFHQWTQDLDAPSVWVIGNHDKDGPKWKEKWKYWVYLAPDARDLAFHDTCYWWTDGIWAWIVIDNNHLPKSKRTPGLMEISEKIVMKRVRWLENIIDTIPVPPDRRLLFAHCPLDKHPLIRTGQTKRALWKMASVMAGKVRYAYFGHQHINSYHHDIGTTPYYTTGFITELKSRKILTKRPANNVRAFLVVDLFESGHIEHNWIKVR